MGGTVAVDAVITWVDGDDPEHQRKRKQFMPASPTGLGREAIDPTRFRSEGEIFFCLHLLRRNAPWIRNVYLVTDNQRPSFLTPEEEERLGVSVVDHRIIFRGYEESLPTFNSRSIETLLHRIPGLSNKFLYLNDDFFLINPVECSDFFMDGKTVWRGMLWPGNAIAARFKRKWRRVQKRWLRKRYVEGLVGFAFERRWLQGRKHLQLGHAPQPLRRQSLASCLEGRIAENVQYRFRHDRQFTPAVLVANYELDRGLADIGPRDWGYLDCQKEQSDAIGPKMAGMIDDPKIRMVCVQSMDMATPEVAEELRSMLQKLLDDGGTKGSG